jgi:hypothetical protein
MARICDKCSTRLERSHGVTYLIQKYEGDSKEPSQDAQQDYCFGCDPEYLKNLKVDLQEAHASLQPSPFSVPTEMQDVLHGLSERFSPTSTNPEDMNQLIVSFSELLDSGQLIGDGLPQLWASLSAKDWILPTVEQGGGLTVLFREAGFEGNAGPFMTACTALGLLPPDTSLL